MKTLLLILSILSIKVSAIESPAKIEEIKFESSYRDDIIILTFTEALQRINQSKIPITIEPQVNCHWSWIDNYNLACNLNDYSIYDDEDETNEIDEQSLIKATQYNFKINNGLLDLNNLKVPNQTKVFNYKPPQLNRVDILYWKTPKIPLIAIEFNQEIKRTSMDSKVFLTTSNQSIPMQQATDEELHKLSTSSYYRDRQFILLRPTQELELNKEYNISISSGIKSMFGPLESSPQTFKKTLQAIGNFEYIRYRCSENRSDKYYQGPCFSDDSINIEFSSFLDPKSLLKCPNIDTKNSYIHNMKNKSILTISSIGNDLSVFDACFDELSDIFSRKITQTPNLTLPKTKGVRPNLILNFPNYTLIPDSEAINLKVTSTNLDSYYLTFQQINNEDSNQTYQVKLENKNNNTSLVKSIKLPIPENQIQSLKGFISIIEPKKETPTNIPFHIQKSPFQVNIKQNLHNILVQVNDIHSSVAVSNAEIEIEYEGKRFTSQTDSSGLSEIQINDLVDDSSFVLKINTDKHSTTYPWVNRFSNHISRSKRLNDDYWFLENSFYLFGLTDKPIYRAGETVNYNIYIRQKKDTHYVIPQSPLPEFKLALDSYLLSCHSFDECNSSYLIENPKVDGFGSISGQFKLPKSAKNGQYSLQAFFKNEEIWTSSDLRFQVSDFKNSEYKLNLTSKTKFVKGTQSFPVIATAEYYSGGPVINEKGEIAGEISATKISSVYPKFNSYRFNSDDSDDRETFFLKNLSFDSNGELKAKYTPPENNIMFGTLKLNAGLKPKAGEWNYSSDLLLPYRQQDYFLGLKFKTWQKNINEEITIESAFIDYKGKQQKPKSIEYFIQNYQDEKWTDFKSIDCKKITKQQCVFTLDTKGYYKLKAVAKKKKIEIEQSLPFYVYDYSKPKITKNQLQINIQSDKQKYQIGDTAKISIYFPEKINQALITTERNQILDKWSKSTTTGVLEIEFPITIRHAPGFDVTVLTQQNNTVNSLKDLNNIRNQSLTINVEEPKESRLFEIKTDKSIYKPKQSVGLNIQSHSHLKSEYTIAVIDQSIVDLIDSKLHYDLTESYYTKSKYYWDLYNNYQISPKDSTNNLSILKAGSQYLDYKSLQDDNNSIYDMFGMGDDDKVELERVVTTGTHISREDLGAHPNQVKGQSQTDVSLLNSTIIGLIKPIEGLSINPEDLRSLFAESAYFKTNIHVMAGQNKTIDIPLPDNITQWRIIVLGTDTSGKLEVNDLAIKASKDLELRSTLPVQVTQGDQFKAQYSVVSKTNKKVKIKAAAQVSQKTQVLETTQTQFSRVKKSQAQSFEITADNKEQGELELTAYVKTKKNADGLFQKVPVRSNLVELSQSQYAQFDSEEKHLQFNNPPNNISEPAHLSVNISMSLIPFLDPVYAYMENYPHQCWEQQSAKAVITAIELASKPLLSDLERNNKTQFINSVLSKAQDFQARNGGMTFFGGNEDNINIYLSMHTLSTFDFLKSLGYKIPNQVQANLKSFATELLDYPHMFSNNIERFKNDELSSEITLLALTYANRESSENHKLQKTYDRNYHQQINEIFIKRQELDTASLTNLLKILDDEPKQKQILKLISDKFYSNNKKFFAKGSNNSPWYLMPSSAKEQCGLISQVLKLNDDLINKDELLKHINGALELRNQQGHFGSTIENTYCAKALYEFSKKYESANQDLDYSVKLNGDIFNLENGQLEQQLEMDEDLSITIQNPEKIQSYMVSQLKYKVPSEKVQQQNIGFNIQRDYFIFNNGSWLPASTYKVGDWVKTSITIHSPISRNFVAVSDPVPGAWLPTDPKLASNMPVGMRESLKHFDNSSFFYEIQLNPATTRFYADYLPAGSHRISYLSQIRSEGVFLAMPALVEEMYDDENRATTHQESINVISDNP